MQLPAVDAGESDRLEMAKENSTAVATPESAQQTAPLASTTEEKKKVVISTNGPAQMSLPELIGHIMTSVLKDHTQMGEMKKQFRIWYDAQDPATKKETAQNARKEIEYSRGILESTYQLFRDISYQDLQ